MAMRKETRIRLPLFFKKYSQRLKRISESELQAFLFPSEDSVKIEKVEGSGSNYYQASGRGDPPITTIEEAIDFFKIDLSTFIVDQVRVNSWSTTNGKGQRWMNYQVRVDLKNKRFDL
jgi:hypothetical protein